jgi:hypothetical protein
VGGGGLYAGARRLRPVADPALGLWFAVQSWLRISRFVGDGVPLGLDARIYYRGAAAWLNGADPWEAQVQFGPYSFTYAGTPATTIVMSPGVLLPEDVFAVGWLLLGLVAAVWILRRLRLPLWWLLFPPTVEALFSGNPQIVVLALLLAAPSVPPALAVLLKAHPLVPLLGERRWRPVALGIGMTLATVLLAPGLWRHYVATFGAISARLAKESQQGWSAFAYPVLFVPAALALLALARRDSRSAGWLAVPALWPATEFHYSTLVLPLRSPLLAAALSVSTMQWPPIAITLYAIGRLAQPGIERWRQARSAAARTHSAPATPLDSS